MCVAGYSRGVGPHSEVLWRSLSGVLVIAMIMAVGAVAAQERQGGQVNKCGALSSFVEGLQTSVVEGLQVPISGRLFIRNHGTWSEVSTGGFFGGDYAIPSYQGERLAFIYVAAPSPSPTTQFLSVRTIADAAAADHFVNLRKQRRQSGSIYFDTYQDYHLSQKPNGPLRAFHRWSDGSRSDEPPESRSAWAFQRSKEVNDRVRRRVLAISYRTSRRFACVPFILGPNIASPVALEGAEDEDEILGQLPFTVEITEAKTAAGAPGRTFVLRGEQQR